MPPITSLISSKQFHGTPRNFPFNHVSPFFPEAFDGAVSHQVHHQVTAPHLGFPRQTVNASKIQWSETPDEHLFETDLPGYSRHEVKVEIEESKILRISGEKNIEKEEKGDRYHRVERSTGKFVRCFRLPENIELDRMTAHLEHGILTVRVPKERHEIRKHHARTITITGK